MKAQVARWLGRQRRSRLGHWIGTTAQSFAAAYENDSGDGDHNGEYRILDQLPPVGLIFDVGAHHGEWTQRVLEHQPDTTVHAFEIDPNTRVELEAALGDPRVTLPACGLADRTGIAPIFVDARYPTTTSMVRVADRTSREVDVERADNYLSRNALPSPDVVKIDAEGVDLAVLEGFGERLPEVGLIQFEFTQWAAINRVWLRDFYDLLQPAGFAIGKVYPGYVEWRDWLPEHEIFVRANFVAVHESRPELRAAIG